jgi:AP-2 complex subunit alpha
VKKKAALCLLRLFKKYPEVVQFETFSEKLLVNMDDQDFGSLTSLMSLVLGLANDNTKYFESYIPKAVGILTRV